MEEWNVGAPDVRYNRWYRVKAQYHWKGRKPFIRCVYAKWLPKTKEWVGYNNKRLNVIGWRKIDNKEIENGPI